MFMKPAVRTTLYLHKKGLGYGIAAGKTFKIVNLLKMLKQL